MSDLYDIATPAELRRDCREKDQRIAELNKDLADMRDVYRDLFARTTAALSAHKGTYVKIGEALQHTEDTQDD